MTHSAIFWPPRWPLILSNKIQLKLSLNETVPSKGEGIPVNITRLTVYFVINMFVFSCFHCTDFNFEEFTGTFTPRGIGFKYFLVCNTM